MLHSRVLVLVVVALFGAGCGDNKPPAAERARAPIGASVSGGMIASSQHYRVVSTVSSGDVNATSSAHTVRGVTVEAGAQ